MLFAEIILALGAAAASPANGCSFATNLSQAQMLCSHGGDCTCAHNSTAATCRQACCAAKGCQAWNFHLSSTDPSHHPLECWLWLGKGTPVAQPGMPDDVWAGGSKVAPVKPKPRPPPAPPSPPPPTPPFDGAATRQQVLATVWANGKIPSRTQPDRVKPLVNVSLAPHATELTWNISGPFFPLSSTVFHNPRSASQRSDTIVLHHHGHAHGCDNEAGCPIWFDFYNVTSFIHDELEADYFMLYMPLLGPNQQHGYPTSHQWFSQWEDKGDKTIRYFVEPLHLTVNYALSLGYKRVVMMGKSGGGWTTTVCAALDPRIHVSFPIAGSIPLSFHHVSWDYEQKPQAGKKDW